MSVFFAGAVARRLPPPLPSPAPRIFRSSSGVARRSVAGRVFLDLSWPALPLPREDDSRRSVAREKNRQNRCFRPKSRKNATSIGQKNNKIGYVENIEKADVSCETMQNSPKTERQDKTGCALLRLQKARLRRACCGKKWCLGGGARRLHAQAKVAGRENER